MKIPDSRVVDAYDAMTSTRPDRRAGTPEEARREVRRGAGRPFDPSVAEAFLDIPTSDLNAVKTDAEIAARDRLGIPFEAASIS